jgi:glycosyltransferase involved in cell wall biosynthesis
MKIGIDARMMGPESRGIGRYIERLLAHLAELDNENEYTVFVRTEAVNLVPKKMKAVIADIRWYTLAEQTKLGKIFDAEKLDIVHVPHWNAPLRLKTPLAITIHDMILWEHPSLASTTLSPLVYWTKYFFYRFVVSQNVKRAKIVFTVSESAKNSILRNLKISPEKITVTPLGIDTLAEARPRLEEVSPQSPQPYILSVGSGYPHKNMTTFFKVAKELMTSDSQLATVVAGTDPAFMEKLKRQAGAILGKDISRVSFAGLVSDTELGKLYKDANAFIFTSQVEGFGLPPLEAALLGAPVIASSIDTSREMLGNAVPLVEPTDVAGFVGAYRKIMADSAYKTSILSAAKARAQTFSWERTAECTLAGYKHRFSTRLH